MLEQFQVAFKNKYLLSKARKMDEFMNLKQGKADHHWKFTNLSRYCYAIATSPAGMLHQFLDPPGGF